MIYTKKQNAISPHTYAFTKKYSYALDKKIPLGGRCHLGVGGRVLLRQALGLTKQHPT